MDPSRNNLPLQFNMNKNQPHVRIGTEDDVSSSTNQNTIMANNTGNGGDPNMIEQIYNMMGPMVPMATPMTGDPNMMMMNQMNFNNFGGTMGGANMMGQMGSLPGAMGSNPGLMGAAGLLGNPALSKEVITLKSSVLYPPPAGSLPRSTRERPPGCRTIFVGGIPLNSTEDILFEMFESCGPIESIRISKKKFAHIRFEHMQSVDTALYISGYRVRINDSDEDDNTGRIHVDFAQARDDQYEFECQQRALAREMRHWQREEEARNRPPSPELTVFYSDHEGSLLLDKLKSGEDFNTASQSLITWLERGECNRRTANQFYSMVQRCHSQLVRINSEKCTVEAEMEQYKIQFQQKMFVIAGQVSQVERVLQSAHKQKCWDHFTKAQRKNIDTWLRQAQGEREKDEKSKKQAKEEDSDNMDLSDDDDFGIPSASKKIRTELATSGFSMSENNSLKEENDNLKCQMEAFKNEVDMVRQEGKQEVVTKEKQIKSLQNALQGMQQQLIAQRAAHSVLEASAAKSLEASTVKSGTSDPDASADKDTEKEVIDVDKEDSQKVLPSVAEASGDSTTKDSVTSTALSFTDKEAKMIGLICCFLNVHPHGATVDYIWSYLLQLVTNIKAREVEDLLEKIPSLFQQEIHGVGAGIERRWVFSAINRVSPP